eukprot:7410160-Pyramimonas_sp.AAC.1
MSKQSCGRPCARLRVERKVLPVAYPADKRFCACISDVKPLLQHPGLGGPDLHAFAFTSPGSYPA